MNNRELLYHINQLHTTKLGMKRLKKNLKIEEEDVVSYCKNKIKDKRCHIERRGKNWYAEIEGIRITINANSYTIITAHMVK